jgi:hypothetical protein
MSRKDTMRDPRYSSILFAIESKLHEADCLALARGLSLTDSNIRSLLVRAMNDAKGKAAKAAEKAASDKEQFLAEALEQVKAIYSVIVEEQQLADGTVQERPLPVADWLLALDAIKDSCAIRTTQEPGSRGYLEYLKSFMKDAARAQ